MNCSEVQEHLSAVLDGEEEVDPAVDRHVTECAACRRHSQGLAPLHAAVRLSPALEVPDRTEAILAAIHADQPTPRRTHMRELTAVLGFAGIVQIVLALPIVFGGSGVHVARELGGWQLALGAALLVTAWQPRRASGLLPFVAVAAGLGILLAAQDLVAGRTTLLSELGHLVELTGVLIMGRLSQRAGRLRRSTAAAA